MQAENVQPKYMDYLRDESRIEGQAAQIIFPQDTAQLAAAIQQNSPICIQGARTGIVGGAVPQDADALIINTQQMSSILGVRQDGGDFYLRLQAGVTLDQLSAYLLRPADAQLRKAGRLLFAPNPTEGTATLGGIFSCNAGGMNAVRYGQTSQHIQALQWVTYSGNIWEIPRGRYVFTQAGCPLPDGSFLSCRTDLAPSPLAKQIASPGLDLIDFLAGSEGDLGVVSGLELRLTPQPQEGWGVLYFFSEQTAAMDFISAMIAWQQADSSNTLCAAEYYDAEVLHLLQREKPTFQAVQGLPDFPEEVKGACYLELCGDDAAVLEGILFSHLELFLQAGGKEQHTWAAGSFAELEKYRKLRHGIPELLNMMLDRRRQEVPQLAKTATDYRATPHKAAQYIIQYQRDIAEAAVPGYLFGHFLENHFHVNFLPETPEQLQKAQALQERWAIRVVQDGGVIAAENGVGKCKRALAQKLLPEDYRQYYQGIWRFFQQR